MLNYYEKIEQKKERFQALAKKAAEASAGAYEASHRLGSLIPFGQPILIGHHSEGKMRRLGGRIHDNMRKSIELDAKAKYYEEKAENMGRAISSDAPDAIDRLKAKLEKLMTAQEAMKAANARARTAGEPKPYGYQLKNNNQNINTIKKRITTLEKAAAREVMEDIVTDLGTLHEDKEANRFQIFFTEIPSAEIRAELKTNGFRWAPSAGAWQAFRNNRALFCAKNILKITQ